jgi:NAD(P)-dependent dehydrogenase (short-subunit alcohol dehydrogenase family)
VNVNSVAGLLRVPYRAAYNASKPGLIGPNHSLAAERGGRGVRVNAVCSGWVKMEMDEEDQGAGGYTDAAFLADPDWSGFVNGHTLSVDGGWFGDGSWEGLRRGKQGSR